MPRVQPFLRPKNTTTENKLSTRCRMKVNFEIAGFKTSLQVKGLSSLTKPAYRNRYTITSPEFRKVFQRKPYHGGKKPEITVI